MLYVCQTFSSVFLRRPNGEVVTNILIFAKLGRRGDRMGGAFGFRSNGLGSSPSQDLCCVLGQKKGTVPNIAIMGHYNGCLARHNFNNDVKKSLIQ